MSTLAALATGVRAARQERSRWRSAHVGQRAATRRLSNFVSRLGAASGTILGFGFLTAAAWTVALPLGLAAAGLSFLLLEWRLAEGEER